MEFLLLVRDCVCRWQPFLSYEGFRCPEGRSLTENFQFFSYGTLYHRQWEPLYQQPWVGQSPLCMVTHGLLKLEDGTLVLSRRVMACRVDFNHNLKKKGSIDRALKTASNSPKHLSSKDMKLKDIYILVLRGRERCSLVVST